jgi:hypothetical protein
VLTLVVRRAWAQRRLLSAVVILVTLAATLMGFYALLLGVTGPRAFSEQVQRSEPEDLSVTAYVVGVTGPELEVTRRQARGVVEHVLGPLHPTLTSTVTSQIRELGDTGRLGYLATTDARAGRGTLTSGRWPHDGATGAVEAVVPDAAARGLSLHLGDRLTLGPGVGLGESDHRATVVVVGTFRGLPRDAAESDPLSGAGFDPTYNASGVTAPTYGPFLVSGDAFVSTGLDVSALRVDGQPDLRAVDDATLRGAAVALGSASALLSNRVGGSADITRVGSDLPATLDRLHTQESTTRSAVLVALLLDTVLGLAALVLAGRLLADTRKDEGELLTTFGLGRGQQVTAALVEGVLLAATAAVLAVPCAAWGYAAVTHLPSLRAAGLGEAPTLTTGLLVTAFVGAALLTLVLVVSPLVSWESERLGRRRAVARSGVDVLLLVVASAAWWQLDSRPTPARGGDTLAVVAPVLCLAAATVVAVRALAPLFALGAAVGARSRSLLPVSLHPPALRLGGGTALVLLSLASASATFGVAVHSTWQRSQSDQADLQVGTDLSLALDAPPTAEDSATVDRAVRRADAEPDASLVSPVTDRPVALGHYFGDPGEPPELVALDARHADVLLRGRLPEGTTWSEVGRGLVPRGQVRGVPMPAGGAGVTLTGHAPPGVAVSVTPTLVLQDASGFRSTLYAVAVPADGRSRPLRWASPPLPSQAIVAVQLTFTDDGSRGRAHGADAAVSVDLRVPGPDDVRVAGWQTREIGSSGAVTNPSTSLSRAGSVTVLATRVSLNLSYLLYGDGGVLATAFEPPGSVPVAVSQSLVGATGAKVGDELSATVFDSVLLLHVVRIVPTVPSAPGRIAVLADVDAVSRALIGTGHLEPVVNAFWVSHPPAGVVGALSGLELGDVTTQERVASELTRGPLQVTLPVAYVTVAGSAALLLLAGAVLVVGADQRRRTAEVSRLRALGLSRRGARRLVFAQHGALLGALVLTGVLIGGAAAVALDRLLVRSEEGTPPVPAAVLAWPWVTQGLVAGGLVLVCLVTAAVAAAWQVRVSDTSRLREGD